MKPSKKKRKKEEKEKEKRTCKHAIIRACWIQISWKKHSPLGYKKDFPILLLGTVWIHSLHHILYLQLSLLKCSLKFKMFIKIFLLWNSSHSSFSIPTFIALRNYLHFSCKIILTHLTLWNSFQEHYPEQDLILH